MPTYGVTEPSLVVSRLSQLTAGEERRAWGLLFAHALKIPYFRNRSGLRDAIGLSQEITVSWCLNFLNSSKSTCALSSVTASVFGEALMPGLLLAVADL